MKPAVAPTALALWRSTAADTARGVGAAARPAVTDCRRAIQVAARSASALARSASARAASAAWCRRALSIASPARPPSASATRRSSGPYGACVSAATRLIVPSTLPRAAIGTTSEECRASCATIARISGSGMCAVQQVPVDVLDQLGLARARHLRRPDRRVGRQRQARAQLARERDAVGIGVRRGGGDEGAVLVEQVDHAPVAEPRHAEVGEPLERRLQVERLGQQLPGRDQEAQALVFPRRVAPAGPIVSSCGPMPAGSTPKVVFAKQRGGHRARARRWLAE